MFVFLNWIDDDSNVKAKWDEEVVSTKKPIKDSWEDEEEEEVKESWEDDDEPKKKGNIYALNLNNKRTFDDDFFYK